MMDKKEIIETILKLTPAQQRLIRDTLEQLVIPRGRLSRYLLMLSFIPKYLTPLDGGYEVVETVFKELNTLPAGDRMEVAFKISEVVR